MVREKEITDHDTMPRLRAEDRLRDVGQWESRPSRGEPGARGGVGEEKQQRKRGTDQHTVDLRMTIGLRTQDLNHREERCELRVDIFCGAGLAGWTRFMARAPALRLAS